MLSKVLTRSLARSGDDLCCVRIARRVGLHRNVRVTQETMTNFHYINYKQKYKLTETCQESSGEKEPARAVGTKRTKIKPDLLYMACQNAQYICHFTLERATLGWHSCLHIYVNFCIVESNHCPPLKPTWRQTNT